MSVPKEGLVEVKTGGCGGGRAGGVVFVEQEGMELLVLVGAQP